MEAGIGIPRFIIDDSTVTSVSTGPLDPEGHGEDTIEVGSGIGSEIHFGVVVVGPLKSQSLAELAGNDRDFTALGSVHAPNGGGYRIGGSVQVVIEIPIPNQAILQSVLGTKRSVYLDDGFVARRVGNPTRIR